jgi:hypothetical protein
MVGGRAIAVAALSTLLRPIYPKGNMLLKSHMGEESCPPYAT